ncbi:MarR family transcriptional regulator [Gemmiger formicilis]|uniref:MarR family winged helix-turn-helix transcriptional regulator n=1 Tax=Gemmiger formicilis TaxID=745368 RepID=UPI00195B8A3F|nr:MarR family transcriptional regulator [Gemmiger formicilis]MBM6717943.1 MarR family transcriptional regulator [Gemmiger formicilis]
MEPLHYLLMKTQSQLHRQIMAQAADLGLSPGQPKILECLSECGECNQKTIARYCEIEQATVGSILLRMERDGLVRRTQKDGNRRALYVSLTDRGRQAALQVQQIFQQYDARAVSGLSTEESLLLNQLLQRVYDAISQPERKSF